MGTDGDAEDRQNALVDDDRVDDVRVLLVCQVVAGPARGHGFGHLTAQSESHAEPDGVELGAGGALGHPHVRVASLGVEQHDVGEIGPHELAGPADGDVQDRVLVLGGGQFGGRVQDVAEPAGEVGGSPRGTAARWRVRD